MNKQVCLSCETKFKNKPYMDVCPVCKSKYILHDPIDYVNRGDINYFSYGGNLVFHSFPNEDKESEWYKYNFKVFRLHTPFDLGEGDDVYMAMLYDIDVRDYEENKKDILYLSGNEDKIDVPWLELFGSLEALASEIVASGYSDCYETYQGYYLDVDNAKCTLEEVKDWLTKLGIDITEL